MFLKQIYTSCLSEASYFIESEGEAVVIDPIREPHSYLELAHERNANIKYIFETHFHADFISGHQELADKTGATIVFGPGAETGFQAHCSKDGEEFRIGKLTLITLHTPGHTPESSCFLLKDEFGKNHAIFTGDTLFIGDVGRPDLAVKSDLSQQDLAGMLYDSIHSKILTLEDEIMVYPGHGPGSACGKNIGKETFSTLGQQKLTNYALQPMQKDVFIKTLTEGILPAPSYFSIAAEMNKNGIKSVEDIINKVNNSISLDKFKFFIQNNYFVLDTRNPDDFEKGFIPNSVNIGLNGQFAIWAGTLLNYQTPILLICDAGKEEKSMIRLLRVGFENIAGFLVGGFETWKNANEPINTINSIEPEDIQKMMTEGWKVLDVRKPGEFEAAHINDSKTLHLQALENRIGELDKNTNYLVMCAGGYRSMIAASILLRNGYSHIMNVHKGWSGVQKLEGLDIVSGPCEMEKKLLTVNEGNRG